MCAYMPWYGKHRSKQYYDVKIYRKRDKKKMKRNPSQYSGTLKNTICTRCNKQLNSLTREEQDRHEIKCKSQRKMFEWFITNAKCVIES